METTNTQLTINPGDLVSVDWLDAADHSDVSSDSLKKKKLTHWLVPRTTYGKLFKQDDTVVVLIQDEDEDGSCEITAIPKQWTTGVRKQ